MQLPLGTRIQLKFTDNSLSETYLLKRYIGEGGMGQVYKAKRQTHYIPGSPEFIAIKVFGHDQDHLELNKMLRKKTYQANQIEQMTEFNFAKSYFSHVTAFTFQKNNVDYYCLSCEFINGIPVENYDVLGTLTFSNCMQIAAQIALTLSSIHQTTPSTGPGLIHRDLSFANILIDILKDGSNRINTRIIDFGMAIPNAAQDSATVWNSTFWSQPNVYSYQETIFQNPPENFAGVRTIVTQEEIAEPPYIGTRSDIFAFGLALLKLFGEHDALNIRENLCANYKPGDFDKLVTLIATPLHFDPELKKIDHEFAPTILRELAVKFVKRMVYFTPRSEIDLGNHAKMISDYAHRPSGRDCLQFFIWMHQLCILTKRKQTSDPEYSILLAKARLLIENVWSSFHTRNWDREKALTCFITQLPMDETIHLEKTLQDYPDKAPKLPEHLKNVIYAAHVPVTLFEEAIIAHKFMPELLVKTSAKPAWLRSIYHLLEASQLSMMLQKLLLAYEPLEMSTAIQLMSAIKNSRIATWVETYLFQKHLDQETISIDTLTYNDVFTLMVFVYQEDQKFVYLAGRDAIDQLRDELETRLFKDLDKYHENISQLCQEKGEQYHRGWAIGSPIGEKKQAFETLKRVFFDFMNTSNRHLFFQKSFTKHQSALTRGELGRLSKPLFERLKTLGVNLANPIPLSPNSLPDRNNRISF